MSGTDNGDGFLYLFFMIAILCCVSFRGCFADPNRAVSMMEKNGFEDVEILNHGWLFPSFRGCGADAAIVAVKAVNVRGERVNLDVCLGWPFKGATIRGD